MSVVFFREGPLDGKAYELEALMGHGAAQLPIIEYNWTPEKITSPSTGMEARVWLWKGASPEGRQSMTAQQEADAEAEAEKNPAPPSGVIPTETRADGQPPAGPMPELQARRLRLKAARPEVATLAGISVPTLARIEQGSPRTTEAEREAVAKALTQLEENGASGRGGRGKSPKVSNA
jgi:hypothetical protein